MNTQSLRSKLGFLALVGSVPTACADDIANPFNMGTEGTGSTTTAGSTSGGNNNDSNPVTDSGTSGSSGNGTTVGLDDTGTSQSGTTSTSTTGADGTTTTGGSTEGSSTDTAAGSSSSGGVSTHIPCPGGDIPTDMGLPVTVNANSTLQDSEFVGTCGGGGAPDFAWTFTAPADGDYVFDTFQSQFDTVLYILDGLCTGDEIVCDDDGLAGTNQSLASVSMLDGETVTVVVDAFGLAGGAITLTVREGSVTCPAEEITTVPTTIAGQTIVATNEFTGSCGNGTSADQGYLFTAPQDGVYTFETTSNDFDTVLFLLEGNCGGTEVACNNDLVGALNGASGLTYPMLMGEQVTVIVDGFFDAFGNYDLDIGLLEGDCPDADLGALATPFTVAGTTIGEDNASAGSCGGLASADFTWTWTSSQTATYSFSTQNTDFDTVVYVTEGADCLGNEIGCGNDNPLNTDGSAIATVAVGDTVSVHVDGNGGEGSFDLVVEVDCPAQDLGNVVPQTITADTVTASDQFTGTCSLGAAPDEGFTFTAPSDGTYVFETSNNDFDTIMFVVDATCGGNELACNDNEIGAPDGHSILSVPMAAGELVTVVVEGVFGAVGTFDLSVSALAGTCPDADLAAMPTPFTVSGATVGEDNATGGTCGGLSSADFAWTWTSPETATYSFTAENADFDALVYVYEGADCLGAELSCSNNPGMGFNSSAVTTVAQNDTVTIIVDGNGSEGNFDLTVEVDCPAADLGNTVPQQISADTLTASDTFVGTCSLGAAPDEGFTFTAPADGMYTFESVNNDFDTILYVLDAMCGGNELACNDNGGAAAGLGGSSVTVALSQDEVVTVVVEGVFGSIGSFDLTVD